MSQYSREELLELAAGYALGATTPEESAAIEAALPTSPELAAEVSAFREVSVQLAQQNSMRPSPSVRNEFLSRVAASKSAVIPAAPVVRGGTRIPAWIGIALAASILVAVGFGLKVQSLKKELATRDAAFAATAENLAHRETLLNSLLYGEKDLHIVHLKASDTVTGPGVQFFWNEKQNIGIAHVFRLKPAPAGRAYQIWLLVNGKPVSIKVFNSEPDGHALVEGMTLPASVDGVTDVLITEEPAGGSPLPTTPPFIGGKMRAT